MKNMKKSYSIAAFTLMTLLLFLAACTNGSTNEDSLTSDQEIGTTAIQTIQTQNYSISINGSSEKKVFSASTLDGDLVVSMVSEEELLSDYPAIFDELAMHGVTSGSSGKIYYDDPSINREVKSEL